MSGSSRASSPYPSSRATSAFPPTTVGSPEPEWSTAPSSPPPFADEHDDEEEEDEDEIVEEKWEKINVLLEKVTVYMKVIKQQMDSVKHVRPKTAPASRTTRKRPRESASDGQYSKQMRQENHEDVADGRNKQEECAEEPATGFTQPVLVTGGKLKEYQLEGVAWMVGLYQNGISGILADEMGLGKTLQTISFNAWLRTRSVSPFMVVCPLSVLNNWASEFRKFAPDIPICVYHGTREERDELRRTQMVMPQADREKWWLGETASQKRQTKGKRKASASAKKQSKSTKAKTAGNSDGVGQAPPLANQKTTFPVVITTYEMVINDRDALAAYRWGFIVVDEGHRLKNLECKLIRELKSLTADARMVLTGTPLHNNLAELWSLLNFVVPGIFQDLETFQEWFEFPTTGKLTSPRVTKLISTLHSILRPFILRRLKSDVETNLPPKKEYILYAPLTTKQRELYDAILQGSLRATLLKGKGGSAALDIKGKNEPEESEEEQVQRNTRGTNRRRAAGKKRLDPDGDDDEYFKQLESGELESERLRDRSAKTVEELGEEWQYKRQVKKINNMRLQNTVMQLRKVCSHPFLFDWPVNHQTMQPILNHELITASGKMMLLEQLLDELFETKHKVLLFSQFTTMLDIIEDWATELKGWPISRIDGSTSMADRQEQVDRFQNGGEGPDAPRLFLLSTRAGGLGLNLVAADTVIFYDQDWNPQMDLQAQDRAHRIGQTRPVLIFRLVTAHTVETKIMQRAGEKRKLEALVIAKGKFRAPAGAAAGAAPLKSRAETMAEMTAALLRLEGEQISVAEEGQSVISEADLDALLDRRPQVFVDRGKGWTSNEVAGLKEKTVVEGKTAFAVYEAPINEGGDMLAGMMDEPTDD